MKKKDRFKQKGQNILNSRPSSMRDFLEDQKDTQMHKDAITQLHKTTKPQKHKSANVQSCNYTESQNADGSERDNDRLERIHVQIRKDLADKLIEMVYVRKREGKKATQRHIIEQALKEYFAK
jgi:LPS O-antigen subunit length determinant protein (WzzB/FepE family)